MKDIVNDYDIIDNKLTNYTQTDIQHINTDKLYMLFRKNKILTNKINRLYTINKKLKESSNFLSKNVWFLYFISLYLLTLNIIYVIYYT